jgi:hypothetical protein
MTRVKTIAKSGIFIAVCRAIFSYLDPGSGSLIIQVLVAIVVGILATFRFWKARLLSLFGIQPDTDDEDEDEGAQ